MDEFHQVRVIGYVRSTLSALADAPRQGHEGAPDAWLEIDDEFAAGLEGIAAGQELWVLTWLHAARRDVLRLHPRDDPKVPICGVFNTRSPDRPNPLGLHPVRVITSVGTKLHVAPLEAVDGTPIIDLKPVLRVD